MTISKLIATFTTASAIHAKNTKSVFISFPRLSAKVTLSPKKPKLMGLAGAGSVTV